MKGHELNNATAQEILQRLPEHEHGDERHRSAMRLPQGTEQHPTQEVNQENLHCLDGHDRSIGGRTPEGLVKAGFLEAAMAAEDEQASCYNSACQKLPSHRFIHISLSLSRSFRYLQI